MYRFAMPCPASSLNIYTFIIAEQGELAFVTSIRVGDVQREKIELSDRIDLIAITTFCYGSNRVLYSPTMQRGMSTLIWNNRCYGKLNRIFVLYRPLKFFPEDIFQVLTEWCWNWNWLHAIILFHVLIFRIYVLDDCNLNGNLENRILELFLEFWSMDLIIIIMSVIIFNYIIFFIFSSFYILKNWID